jgi:histidine triad (HIT) family protein
VSSIFSLIIQGKLPSKKVFENERILAIEDIHPIAPVHILIIPKKQIPNLQSLQLEDFGLLTEIIEIAQDLARAQGIQDGYRLLTNNGPDAGQTIFHLHFHLIGGKVLGPMG